LYLPVVEWVPDAERFRALIVWVNGTGHIFQVAGAGVLSPDDMSGNNVDQLSLFRRESDCTVMAQLREIVCSNQPIEPLVVIEQIRQHGHQTPFEDAFERVTSEQEVISEQF